MRRPLVASVSLLVVTSLAAGDALGKAAPAPPPPPAAPGAPAAISTIEVWVRGPGAQKGDQSPRGRSMTVSLDELSLVDRARFDVQYAQRRTYRGVALQAVLDRFGPDPQQDLAILHFANGMAVALPFRDRGTMSRLDPFVARGISGRGGAPSRLGVFPSIARKDARADARPIRFLGNKIVVGERWHPEVAARALSTFSPWTHTDTLVGIELVESVPYYRQFDVGDSEQAADGFRLYRQSCQFCHGARKVGAKMGWDFVEPAPIYDYRKQMNLYFHVAIKPLDAAERGLLMPAMRFMSEDDAAELWQWLKAVGTKPMRPYQPTAAAAPAAPSPSGVARP
jgi:mono/diheme cytochrome c family protein